MKFIQPWPTPELDNFHSSQFAVNRAERRYRAVDPDNRLVARALEREWEEALRALEAAKAELVASVSATGPGRASITPASPGTAYREFPADASCRYYILRQR
jgi:hypothetical protein